MDCANPYFALSHESTRLVHKSRVFDQCVHAVLIFICSDLKCIECNNCSPINNFRHIGHQQKFIHIKNKHVKYSRGLIWVTYLTYGTLIRIIHD